MRIDRTMQWVGYALYAIAGLEPVIDQRHPASWAWLVAYVVLGVAFHVGASVPSDRAHRRRRLGALAVMTPAVMAMSQLRPCTYGALTLVVIASQAALVVTPRLAVLWVLAQTAAVSLCLIPTFGWLLGSAEIIALLGFQAFAVAAIASARGEADARTELARLQERTRISRDLHDVLGHNLTALGLQLEIATHLGDEAARVQTAKARALTSRLLGDVRAVVAAMRTDTAPELVAAIRAIVVEVPGLQIHLDAPESLVVAETSRADCVVRCVQEIVTNTRRHARGAANLWIRLRREADALVVEAHDDGSAATEPSDGQGLRGMRSRLEEMGGGLEVRSAPFAVSARLPLGAGA
jgi:signal transduction histidine kinase